jgi:uncharacterized membrane protein
MRRAAIVLFQVLIAALLALGVVSGVKRGLSVMSDDTGALDREQIAMVAQVAGLPPDSAEYARLSREIPASARGLNERPRATLLHVLPGAIFFILVPLQFSRRIRARHPAFHRWNGRAILVTAGASALAGMYLGIASAYGGPLESAATTIFGGWFLLAAARAWRAIRRRDVARHREWMIRMFAIGIGISVIRMAGLANLLVTGPESINQLNFALDLWVGWLLSAAVAELWIIRTRTRATAESEAALQPL